MKWFEGRETRARKAAVRNAIAVMTSDGRVDDRELDVLRRISERVGLPSDELEKLLEEDAPAEFVVPATREERVRQLLDMVLMMLADGEIDPREVEWCTAAAGRMGFSETAIPALLDSVVASMRDGRSRAEIFVQVGAYLGR